MIVHMVVQSGYTHVLPGLYVRQNFDNPSSTSKPLLHHPAYIVLSGPLLPKGLQVGDPHDVFFLQ